MNCQRQKFLLQRKYAYLNCAYMSPQLKKVENAGKKGLIRKRKPYQIESEDFFRESAVVKQLFAQLLNTQKANHIAIIPSVSYGMANITHNISKISSKKKGDILVAAHQFPSNIYPWLELEKKGFKVKIISPSNPKQKGESWNDAILKNINNDTVILAISHVHWAEGTLFHLKRFREKLNEVKGLLIVDGTQSVGALPFDVQDIQPDALICAAYKWLMGPYSIGLAYYGDVFQHATPIEQSWINRENSENFSGLVQYQDAYKMGMQKFEVGESSHFILLPMLIAALKQVLKWEAQNIQTYCANLIQPLLDFARDKEIAIENENYRAHHLLGLGHPQFMKQNTINILKKRKVVISQRGQYLRVSPHVYNDEVDIKKLLGALDEILKQQ